MKQAWKVIRREAIGFVDGIGRHGIGVHAASGAFYFFLSLTPFLILVCSVLPYTPLTEEMILSRARDIVPSGAIDLIESIVSDVYGASAALVPVSALAMLWSAGKAFSSLIRGMEEVNDVPKRSRYIMRRLRAMLYTLLLLLAILVSLMLMVYGERLMELIVSQFPDVSAALQWLVKLRFLIVMLGLMGVFLLLYKWVPHVKCRYSRELPGAIFAAVAWVLFSALFSAYVSNFDSFSTYGSLATIAISMLWMYYCMYIILLGDYLNRYLDVLRGRKPLNEPFEEEKVSKR